MNMNKYDFDRLQALQKSMIVIKVVCGESISVHDLLHRFLELNSIHKFCHSSSDMSEDSKSAYYCFYTSMEYNEDENWYYSYHKTSVLIDRLNKFIVEQDSIYINDIKFDSVESAVDYISLLFSQLKRGK